MSETPVPVQVSINVDSWVESELSDSRKYENRQPLDESGVWSLHRLVAVAYAQGWGDGTCVAEERSRKARQRERDRAKEPTP